MSTSSAGSDIKTFSTGQPGTISAIALFSFLFWGGCRSVSTNDLEGLSVQSESRQGNSQDAGKWMSLRPASIWRLKHSCGPVMQPVRSIGQLKCSWRTRHAYCVVTLPESCSHDAVRTLSAASRLVAVGVEEMPPIARFAKQSSMGLGLREEAASPLMPASGTWGLGMVVDGRQRPVQAGRWLSLRACQGLEVRRAHHRVVVERLGMAWHGLVQGASRMHELGRKLQSRHSRHGNVIKDISTPAHHGKHKARQAYNTRRGMTTRAILECELLLPT